MATFNVSQARAQFSSLLRRALIGEEIVIARAGTPIAKLVPLKPPSRQRVLGSAEGEIWIAPDFDETPEDITKAFER